MNAFVGKYKVWFEKTTKNIELTKGQEGFALLSRFRSLQLDEDQFGVLKHVTTLYNITSELTQERRRLKWLEKFEREVCEWKEIFDSLIRSSEVEFDSVVRALVEDEIDSEFAISVVQHG